MKLHSQTLIAAAGLCCVLFVLGCGQSPTSVVVGGTVIDAEGPRTYPTSVQSRSTRSLPNLTFVVPEHVTKTFKMKCYICHGGAETKGGFNLKQMTYQAKGESEWRPMDLTGVTRIKLAILPLDGKSPRMPKRAGSILNSLTVDEANAVAKWTDYPYER